jgi:hypothetical protein
VLVNWTYARVAHAWPGNAHRRQTTFASFAPRRAVPAAADGVLAVTPGSATNSLSILIRSLHVALPYRDRNRCDQLLASSQVDLPRRVAPSGRSGW